MRFSENTRWAQRDASSGFALLISASGGLRALAGDTILSFRRLEQGSIPPAAGSAMYDLLATDSRALLFASASFFAFVPQATNDNPRRILDSNQQFRGDGERLGGIADVIGIQATLAADEA